MNTKLTLSIDKKVIQNAKIYAVDQKRSISKLVEEYLTSISQNTAKKSKSSSLSPITSELLGMVKLNKKVAISDADLLVNALSDKYL